MSFFVQNPNYGTVPSPAHRAGLAEQPKGEGQRPGHLCGLGIMPPSQGMDTRRPIGTLANVGPLALIT